MKNKLSNKYKVPNDYFATMENEILSKVNQDKTAKVVPFYQQIWVKTAIGIAASLLLIFGVYFSMQEKVTPEDHAIATEIIYDSYFEEEDNLEEFTLEDDSLYEDMILLADD